MEKSTESFFKKLFGKKKKGCCDVVIEEIGPETIDENPAAKPGTKCCGETADQDR